MESPTLTVGESDVPSMEQRLSGVAVTYLRVSSQKQVDKDFDPEGFSIPVQRDACARYCVGLGAYVAASFIDAGESAQTTDRPDLQRLLRYIEEHRVDYVVLYDVSRLARNELDAFQLLDSIERAGARLVSVTENFDTSTPEGRLMFAMLAGTQAFRSRGDGAKIKAGLRRKHQTGGTPGVAPLGYLNIPVMVEGRLVRTITIDEERAPLIKLAFEAYASGEYTISSLTELLRAQGLRTVARGSRPSRPVCRSYVHKLLSNPYYIGIIEFTGVRHPGRHEPLIEPAIFDKVQLRLAANTLAGDRSHKHQHYLKGSVFCGRCGAMLSYGRHRSRSGDHYEYFGCVRRMERPQPCPYIAVDLGERAVERYWVGVQLSERQRELIRTSLLALVAEYVEVAKREVGRREADLRKLEDNLLKLLQLYYEGDVGRNVLRREQTRIEREQTDVRRGLEAAQLNQSEVREALDDALELTRDSQQRYASADPLTRRLMNQAVFERLELDQEWVIEGEKHELFRELDRLSCNLEDEVRATRDLDGSRRNQTADPDFGARGSVLTSMVQLTGALSNHDGGVSLRRVLDGKRRCVGIRGRDAPGPRRMRPAQGAIQAAVLRVLGDAQAAVGIGEIHRLVEDELGRPVSRDTVASFLSVACRARSPAVTRVARGLYALGA